MNQLTSVFVGTNEIVTYDSIAKVKLEVMSTYENDHG